MKTENTKLNLLDYEILRERLIEQDFQNLSFHQRAELYFNYFENVLKLHNSNFIETLLAEFVDEYFLIIKQFECFGVNPSFTEKLLAQLNKLKDQSFIQSEEEFLSSQIARISFQFEALKKILEGNTEIDITKTNSNFPLIHNSENSPLVSTDNFYGLLDSISIRINKTTAEDRFIFIPSEREIEIKLSQQCKISWKLALRIIGKYVKRPYKQHEVIISFEKKIGFYEGNSLGIALCLAMIEELLKFYNPPYTIAINPNNAFTGGVTETGDILNIGEKIIKQKVKTIFYSDIKNFVIPKFEETYAQFTLTQLKELYPHRNLKIIPVENFDDILNRRDLVEIKKINPAVRTAKFVKANSIGVILLSFILLFMFYLFLVDLDDNPSFITLDGNRAYIKNKHGKVLWDIFIYVDFTVYEQKLIRGNFLITDIDNDGDNEVIYKKPEFIENENRRFFTPNIICVDKNRNKIWEYTFDDSVYTQREGLHKSYSITEIGDTITIDGRKLLLFIANSRFSFSSAITFIDIQNGQRAFGTQWVSGHTKGAILRDINNDNQIDMIGVGADNGFEDVVLWATTLKDFEGYRPTTEEYRIYYKNPIKPIFYIRFPKIDYEIMMNYRIPGLTPFTLTFIEDKNSIRFETFISYLTISYQNKFGTLVYYYNHSTSEIDIIVDNQFRVIRDSLVTKGKLQPPFTDTKEYIEKVKSNILYYEYGKWMKREEMK